MGDGGPRRPEPVRTKAAISPANQFHQPALVGAKLPVSPGGLAHACPDLDARERENAFGRSAPRQRRDRRGA